ncbi:MAG: uroporphyrinogen decarboxylase [Parvibaculales bacterium]
MADTSDKLLLQTLNGQANDIPPIWLMRQAGRYLPEYRATRAEAGGFLDLCYTPALAEEVTLQPIRRYGFDASILFADILLIPEAMGQKLWFETGEGPRLTPISNGDGLNLDTVTAHLAPVIETVGRLSRSLPPETTLIGFAGAPWTVASYMVAGRGTPDQAPARALATSDPQAFQSIIDKLIAASIDYLAAQVEAGAEVLQLFESWASSFHGADFERWCVAPVAAIVAGLRARGVKVPIIGFPRAASYDMAAYAHATQIQALGLDTSADRNEMMKTVPQSIVLQGNLDPMVLVEGGEKLRAAVRAIKRDFAGRPYIFNLGHGIVPQTPPEHVADLLRYVREDA